MAVRGNGADFFSHRLYSMHKETLMGGIVESVENAWNAQSGGGSAFDFDCAIC